MKITKTMSKSGGKFYWLSPSSNVGICEDFASQFVTDAANVKSVDVSISTKNPKKKGYHKVVIEYNFSDCQHIVLNNKKFVVCYAEREYLADMGIFKDVPFWIKVVKH